MTITAGIDIGTGAVKTVLFRVEGDKTEWLGLQVVSTEAGTAFDSVGRVEFIARYRIHGKTAALHEHSRFRKEGPAWLYIDGEV